MRKVAVVTGGVRGIGRAIVERLRPDYDVVVADVAPRPAGETYDYVRCDISATQNIDALFSYIECSYGRLDVLVNDAGVAPRERRDVLNCTEESFDFVLGVNLRGTFFMCQRAARLMTGRVEKLEDYAPRIVNISSMSAYTSSVSRGEYCISKAGISMVTKLFADRLAEYGIPVFEVRPGIIETDMTAGVHEKYQKLIAEGITPLRRFGRPDDVAKAVAALCSGALDFSTGQVLDVDGGFRLRRL